jgi:hypothetical protein
VSVTSLAAQVNVYGHRNDYALPAATCDGVDTVGVWGSNPHAPTIFFNNLKVAALLDLPPLDRLLPLHARTVYLRIAQARPSEFGLLTGIVGGQLSEIELQCELNQPRVIARRDDAAEVAGVNNLSGVLIRKGGVEVADRVAEVDVIE